jgi:predicted AAA+ superfamily ATPase
MKINRAKIEVIKEDLKSFPVVAILGARQVGKTTLAKEINSQYGEKSIYIDLEYFIFI